MAGSAAFSLRLYDEAEAAIGVVLQYWERRAGPDNPETVSALHNLGSVQAQRGQTDEAEKTFLAAYARLPRDGTRQEARPNLETNLGKLYLERGDLDQAGRWLALAADHMVAYYGEREPRTLTVLTARGHWQWLRGNLDEGIATLERIEQVQQSVGGTAAQDRLHTLSVLAAAYRRRGDRDKETHLLQEIVRQAEAFRTQGRADVGSRSAWLRDRIPDYRRLALLRAEEGRLDEAFALSELAKGRRLLDQLGEQAALSAGVVDPGEASKLRGLAAEIASLESRQPSVDDPVERARIAAALLERRHEYQRVRDALRASSQRFAALTDVTPVDLPTAQRLLGTRQLAISYLVDADRLLVLVLDGRDVRAASVEFTPNLRAAVEALPRLAARLPSEPGERLWQQADGTRTWSLGRPQDAVEVPFAALARELGAALLSPASAQLTSEREILILPDGALAALPFELLHAAGAPLFRRHAVHYAQSMSVYQRVVDASRPRRTLLRQPLLAVGAPTFGSVPDDVPAAAPLRSALYRSEGIAWRPLPGARREIEAVARAVPGARKLVGDDASEERLQAMDSRGELLAFRHLHFATHAFFSSDRPELSAIVLRQPGNERADGFLTAAELARYTLDSELTVLSACETAQGRSVDGEGVMGFAYALLVAGNRSTVAALWKVPDDATSELMVAFFRHLRSGQSQAAALAAAKRQLRRSPRFAAPVHWAGFVLYGRP
jgi:CHAT domain-containing protein/tetratricopeptide (TPR) repeat protein